MHSQNPMYVASFQWSAKYIQVPWSIVFATVKQQRRSVPVMCNFTGNTSLLLRPKHPYSLLSFFTLSPIQSVLGAVSKTQLCEEFAVMGLSSDCWGWIHCNIHNFFNVLQAQAQTLAQNCGFFLGINLSSALASVMNFFSFWFFRQWKEWAHLSVALGFTTCLWNSQNSCFCWAFL